jgi:Ca-activated chloride channel family protein
MFQFAQTNYLYFLLLIPVLIIIFIISLQAKKKAVKSFGDIEIIAGLMPNVSVKRPKLKFVLLLSALTFIIIGIAGPQFGTKLKKVKREGIEMIFALDVSNSMMAEDIKPNRLERSKQAISKLIDKLHNDKIGMIVFAGDAYTQLPITTDYSAAKMFLSTISPSIVPKQGTAIGTAINLAMSSFSPENNKSKALIIITDGENHEDNAVEMAEKAKEEGIVVHTIGMGLSKGAPIPVIGSYGQRDFRTDKNGNVVITKLNEQMLQEIAIAGNGIYIRANNSNAGINTLFRKINKMDKTEIESKIYSEYDERFQYAIAVALFLLFVEFLILERKNKFFKDINVFKLNGHKTKS